MLLLLRSAVETALSYARISAAEVETGGADWSVEAAWDLGSHGDATLFLTVDADAEVFSLVWRRVEGDRFSFQEVASEGLSGCLRVVGSWLQQGPSKFLGWQ